MGEHRDTAQLVMPVEEVIETGAHASKELWRNLVAMRRHDTDALVVLAQIAHPKGESDIGKTAVALLDAIVIKVDGACR